MNLVLYAGVLAPNAKLRKQVVGAHYTYSKVPYDDWFQALTGTRLNDLLGLRRNHFDRLLHFGGGFLLMRLIRELIANFSRLGPWGVRCAALSVVMSASMIYELIEWGAAATFGKDVGAAYLGTRGDVVDVPDHAERLDGTAPRWTMQVVQVACRLRGRHGAFE